MNQQSGGLFLAIEGTDGSGKATQVALLASRLKSEGYEVMVVDFPKYKAESSYFVRRYLAGEYGKGAEISPFVAALFYGLDRYDSRSTIQEALSEGKIVIADRYMASNMAHQGTKFKNADERKGFYAWVKAVELQTLGIPQPTRSIVLNASAAINQRLLRLRGDIPDEHEKDALHIDRAAQMYIELSELFPDEFVRLDCVRNDEIIDKHVIHDMVWGVVSPLLPDHKDTVDTERETSVHTTDQLQNIQDTNVPRKSISPEDKEPSLSLRTHTRHNNFILPIHVDGYFVPPGLPPALVTTYATELKWLHDSRIKLAKRMHEYSNRLSEGKPSDYEESLWAAQSIIPFAATIDTSYSVPLSLKHVPNSSKQTSIIQTKLVNHNPKNEMNTLPEILYATSNSSITELRTEIAKWSIEEKYTKLLEALKLSRSFDRVFTYTWEIGCDFRSICHIDATGASIEALCELSDTSYSIPAIVIDAGERDSYEECFMRSQNLYTLLCSNGFEKDAMCALLLGNKMKYALDCSAKDLLVLPHQDVVFQSLLQDIQEVHPIFAESIRSTTGM